MTDRNSMPIAIVQKHRRKRHSVPIAAPRRVGFWRPRTGRGVVEAPVTPMSLEGKHQEISREGSAEAGPSMANV
ncbi:uncharacterized protein BDV14DRAFT_170694, partial [Aspergillus stella-maris]|uniref:uncharacterized protein n=1 Tax=Aspergillus stella-maris TaxID=1810926 RepID=UPI003CCDEFBF